MAPGTPLKVVVSDWVPAAVVNQLRAGFPTVRFARVSPEAFPAAVTDADAVFSWGVSGPEFASAPNLRWMQCVGAGVEGFLDLPLRERGAVLTNMRGVHAPNIAEHILAMMLAFARNLPMLQRGQQEQKWLFVEARQGLFELGGQHLVIVGHGAIGRGLAQRAEALGMTVEGIGRDLTSGSSGMVALHEALGRADHLAIILPLTDETRGMFDRAALAALKPGAFLYNVGRGPVVETDALVDAIRSGHLAGAGLDVTEPEPLPAGHPLWDFPNVLLTAHTSGASPRYWERALPIFEENLRRFMAGETLVNLIDLDAGY